MNKVLNICVVGVILFGYTATYALGIKSNGKNQSECKDFKSCMEELKHEFINRELEGAVSDGALGTVKKVIEAGADIKVQDKEGNTPLNKATETRKLEVAEFLRELQTTTNEEIELLNILLYSASQMGDLETVKEYIALGADVNGKDSDDWTPLCIARLNNHSEIIKELIAAGANVNVQCKERSLDLGYQGKADKMAQRKVTKKANNN